MSGDNGFIEFSLFRKEGGKLKRYERVICFANRKFSPCAVEIAGDTMPATWLEGYRWEDLNILFEAYHDRVGCEDKQDLRELYRFIRAFGFRAGDPLYMHIWRSRLPGQKGVGDE